MVASGDESGTEKAGTCANNTSFCYYKLGEMKDALTYSNIAVKNRPDWDKAYFRKATALLGLDRAQEAEDV